MTALRAPWPAFLCLLHAAAPARALAQDAAIGFGEARASAERLAPLVRLAGKRMGIARAQVDVAGMLANPTFTVQSATKTAHLGTFVSVPLPLFGQRGTSMDAARADVAVSQRELRMAQSDARFFVTLAWIELWAAQERARFIALAAVDAQRLLAIANERFDAGSGARVDVVRTRAGRARADADVASASAAQHAASARLAPWLGQERSAELSARGEIGFAATLPSLHALLELQAQHPALERDRAQASAADARIRAEQRQRWPTVNAELGVSQFDPTTPGTDVLGGLSFELPLLNQRGGAIARARAEKQLAASEEAADLALLRAELEAAYREAEGALAQLQALHDDVLPALLEARQMSEESYRSGRMDLLRLLEAQRALLESQIAEVSARAGYGRALAELERAAGRRLDAGGGDGP